MTDANDVCKNKMSKQHLKSRVWSTLALLVVIAAAGIGVHRSGISLQGWRWQKLGDGQPVLWLSVPWYRYVESETRNCTVQVGQHIICL